MKIAIIVFDGVEELDAIGPWEVFQTAATFDKKFSCQFISMSGESVTASKGLVMGVHGAMDQREKFDMVLIPGGQGTRTLVKDKAFQESLKFYLENAQWLTSVCSGALIYASMGLLKEITCTSHHSVLKLLKKIEPKAKILVDKRYVREGNMVTSAGVSAGIDMALWLVGTIHSVELALQIQHHIEYYPEPPFSDQVKTQRLIDKSAE